jgi:aminoglycoside phosphotransferase (APT) family kinase protein
VAVHEAMAEVDGLNTPRPLGSMPELGLLLLAPVGSGTTLGRMIRGVAHETTVDELERAVTAGADLAARLHGCQATVPGVRTLDGDVARLETELACIRSLVPELASQLSGLIDAAVAFAQAERPMAPVPSHGDFTPSQILVSGDHVGLIDLDDACRGEPGLDLGRFNAYLRLASRKTARGSESGVDDQLCATFLDAYVRARGLSSADTGVLTARMQAYEAVALAHVVVQGWLQLKPARASLALELLEERVGCLDAAVR